MLKACQLQEFDIRLNLLRF